MAALDMCVLRVEQVAKRSRISWKHTSARQSVLKQTQSALPVLDSNETRHVISKVYHVVGEELEFAMQVTYIDRLSNRNLHLKSRIQVLKLFQRLETCNVFFAFCIMLCAPIEILARCSFRPLSSHRTAYF